MLIQPIAIIRTGFSEKFGVPRQSGIADTPGEIVFLPKYRDPEALRGIEGYSHLWLIWEFSKNPERPFSPTVRPPRLGGNRRMGVFATRSPNRPNPLGLSCVRLTGVRKTQKDGTVLCVRGADLVDGTPIYDIKPYLAYTDAHPDAVGGFSDSVRGARLTVEIPEEIALTVPEDVLGQIRTILADDPRPSYQEEPTREYFLDYGGYSLSFSVDGDLLTVRSLTKK